MELKFDFNNPSYEFIKTHEDAIKAIKELEKEDIIGVDIESSGLDPYTSELLLVQIGSPTKSYIFDAREAEDELKILKDLLEDGKRLKLMQNGKFDYGFLKAKLGITTTNIYDTMLAEGVMTAGMIRKPRSLGALTEKYTGMQLDKSVRESFENLKTRITEDQLAYAALDTLVLFPIFESQWPILKKEGLVKIAKLEFAVTTVVSEMELRGVYIDIDRWRGILKDLQSKRDALAQKFQDEIRPLYNTNQVDLFGNMADVINMNSQPQLMDLFNNRLNLNMPSTGDAVLQTTEHPIAQLLRDYRGYEKLLSAFGEGLLEKVNPKTGRLHPDFLQLGTATGRFACSNPNLQQIPRNSEEAPFRECFTPAPGYKLIVADYSSMEMRVLADQSGDSKFIQALKDGRDVHSYTASLMFGLEYSEDFKQKHPEERQAAKIIGFGLMYGMGPGSLARQIGVSFDEGKQYLEKYFKSYPSVRKYLNKLARDAVRLGWSKTPAGRKRWYTIPEKTDPDYDRRIAKIEREAKNHPIQGTNADVTKYALVFLHDRLKKEGVDGYVTHTVHDEVVCEVREDQAEDWGNMHAEEMVRAGELLLKKVPIKVDKFVGDVWEH